MLIPFCDSGEKYRNAFTGEILDLPKADAKIAVSELLGYFPVALCLLDETRVRSDSAVGYPDARRV